MTTYSCFRLIPTLAVGLLVVIVVGLVVVVVLVAATSDHASVIHIDLVLGCNCRKKIKRYRNSNVLTHLVNQQKNKIQTKQPLGVKRYEIKSSFHLGRQ